MVLKRAPVPSSAIPCRLLEVDPAQPTPTAVAEISRLDIKEDKVVGHGGMRYCLAATLYTYDPKAPNYLKIRECVVKIYYDNAEYQQTKTFRPDMRNTNTTVYRDILMLEMLGSDLSAFVEQVNKHWSMGSEFLIEDIRGAYGRLLEIQGGMMQGLVVSLEENLVPPDGEGRFLKWIPNFNSRMPEKPAKLHWFMGCL